jgi:CMP-N-acetylneuraminic acid synthetase
MVPGPALALIPARAGSKGIRRKNLRRLGGASLTALAIRCARAADCFDRIVVTTDSRAIAGHARAEGAEAIMRPADLASDTANVIDVIAHALEALARDRFVPATIALLEPTCPLRTANMVREAMAGLAETDEVFTVTEVSRRFHPAKQFTMDEQGMARRVLAAEPLPVRRQDLGPTFVQNGAVYAFRTSMFERHRSVFGPTPRALVVTAPIVNVDTLEDLAQAARLLRRPARATTHP